MRKIRTLFILVTVLAVGMLSGCAGTRHSQTKKEGPLEPKVTVERMEVSHYWGWWYFSSSIQPTMGEKGNYGAPLELSFIVKVENPNDFPIQLENVHFTVAFEEFDLNTVTSAETQWIPGKKSNYMRVNAMFDGRQSLLSILVASGFKLKEKTGKSGAGAALELLGKWWKDIPNYGFPVYVKEGAAVFNVAGETKVASFNARFPKE